MKVTLLNHTPLWVADKAIGKCWDKPTPPELEFDRESYYKGEIGCYIEKQGCNTERIDRVANKNKHASTIEHLDYTFDIDGISRACLQELARHRMASLSVKSTRYTLKELKEEDGFFGVSGLERASAYVVLTGSISVDSAIVASLEQLRQVLGEGVSNDTAKYCLPEAYKTSLVWTVNARSLQNFLALRTSKAALWEIRDLANEIFNQLPEDHKFLFKEYING